MRARGVVVLGLAQQQRAAALDVAQVDVVAERRAEHRAAAVDGEHDLGLRVIPGRIGAHAEATPVPTAASTGALVKTSASGPMPTSRYCDHRPRACSTRLERARLRPSPAAALPARRRSRPAPRRARRRRAPCRLRACSSITRSIRLAAKVTPAALTTCRSQGASRCAQPGSRSDRAVLRSSSSRLPTRRPGTARTRPAASSCSSSSLIVAKCADTSNTPSLRIATTEGPGGWPGPRRARPASRPSRRRAGSAPGRQPEKTYAVFTVVKNSTA